MSLGDDDAARRALVSSGVVGLTTALLTKGAGLKLEISLPIALAAGITLDYAVNMRHAERQKHKQKESVNFAKNILGDAIRRDLGKPATYSTWGQEYDPSLWRAQLLTGTIGLLAGATISMGSYLSFGGRGLPARDPALGIVDFPRQAGAVQVAGRVVAGGVAWGLYQAADLAHDFGNAAGWFYDLLRPRFMDVLKSVRDTMYGGGQMTEAQLQRQVERVLPEVDVELNQALQNRADSIMRAKVGTRVIVPDGSGLDEMMADLPGIPEVGVEPGRLVVFKQPDGGKIALIWESASQTTKQSLGITKTESGFSVSGQIVPLVEISESTLQRVIAGLAQSEIDIQTKAAALSAHEDEQQAQYGTGRSTSSEADD